MPSKRMSSACVDYVPALCTHRPSLLPIERLSEAFGLAQVVGNDDQSRKVRQTRSFRGSKSRNKVSVGEPAEGSLQSSGTFGCPLPPFVNLILLLWRAGCSRAAGPSWRAPARGLFNPAHGDI